MLKISLLVLFTIGFVIAAIIGFGTWSFQHSYRRDVGSLLDRSAALPDTLLTEADIQYMPKPVQRYLRYMGAIGKPKVRTFRVSFTGKFRQNEHSDWMEFRSEQYNSMLTSTRLFFMKATMKHLPVAGYHHYNNGRASMDIRLLSLIQVEHQAGAQMDTAETVTFFNDMCCMAPATLIDPRISWSSIDSNTVRATFSTNGITISAILYFNNQGELVNFVSNDRYALLEQGLTKAPWSTPLKDYKDYHGRKLASFAETIYSLPTGELNYGQFLLDSISYNPAE